MENFDWTQFTRKIAVKSSVKKLYDAWTTASEIERWFLEKAVFKNADGKPLAKDDNCSAGDTYEWSWHIWDAIEKGKITAANGKDQLQFTFAGDCRVEVKLTQKEEYVIVTLTQSNIPTDEKSKKDYRLGCDSGWSFYLVNLKSVYEGGLDLRNKNEKLKGMLNT